MEMTRHLHDRPTVRELRIIGCDDFLFQLLDPRDRLALHVIVHPG